MPTLDIEVDTADVQAFVKRVEIVAESLPLDTRERFIQLFLSLLDSGGLKLVLAWFYVGQQP